MTFDNKLTRQQNSEFVDFMIFSMADLIDATLRAKGKPSLYEQDGIGLTPIDHLFAPLRLQYQNEVESDQLFHDYLDDNNVSEIDKQLALLWWFESPLLGQSHAEQAQDNISMWGYRRYGCRLCDALRVYAYKQGLSDDDIKSTLSPEDRKKVEELEKFNLEFANEEATKVHAENIGEPEEKKLEYENIDYDALRTRLSKVQCPFRLYPARIRALEIVTKKQLLRKINRNITSQLPQIFDLRWCEQFEKDFEIYGLYEAILYFHTYPPVNKTEPFITSACNLYHEIASLYLTYHRDITESDDPRIQSQLALVRNYGEGPAQEDKFEYTPFPKPAIIPPPSPPQSNPNYSRELPMHQTLKSLLPWLGNTKQPDNFIDELVEHFDTKFTFEGFPGLQLVFFEVASTLVSFDIDPFSSAGQYILLKICEHIEEEYYRVSTQEIECIKCGETFMAEISLNNVNMSLAQGGWICKQCQSSLQ